VTQGNGERIGGVGGLGHFGESEYPRDHRANLPLVCRAVPGNRGFHFARGVQANGEAARGRNVERNPAGLSGTHDRSKVVLRKHALDPDSRWRELIDRLGNPGRYREQSLLER
jgi:hypothetical protein